MLLKVGDLVRYHPQEARRRLPVDRVNRERMMALRGTIWDFPAGDKVTISWDSGFSTTEEMTDIEAA
jgi:hypothetical protein